MLFTGNFTSIILQLALSYMLHYVIFAWPCSLLLCADIGVWCIKAACAGECRATSRPVYLRGFHTFVGSARERVHPAILHLAVSDCSILLHWWSAIFLLIWPLLRCNECTRYTIYSFLVSHCMVLQH